MKNCVFDKGETCSALTTHNCENCSFCKTRRELDAGRSKARARIDSLPKDQYDAIMHKYYRRSNVVEGGR